MAPVKPENDAGVMGCSQCSQVTKPYTLLFTLRIFIIQAISMTFHTAFLTLPALTVELVHTVSTDPEVKSADLIEQSPLASGVPMSM